MPKLSKNNETLAKEPLQRCKNPTINASMGSHVGIDGPSFGVVDTNAWTIDDKPKVYEFNLFKLFKQFKVPNVLDDVNCYIVASIAKHEQPSKTFTSSHHMWFPRQLALKGSWNNHASSLIF